MKQFKTESKRLLDLMINSIYTNQEIFIRELLSNASDASDKLYYNSLQDTSLNVEKDSLVIDIAVDKEKRELIIRDYGIGMDSKDLEKYLGTIAKSDSHAYKQDKEIENDDAESIIGQFGVGFYAAFMVSKRVEVTSKAFGSDNAHVFISSGLDGYSIKEGALDGHGTEIRLTLKDNTPEQNYDMYLEPLEIRSLVQRYSDYIRYPIQMNIDGNVEVLNSMTPLWKRSKSDVTTDQLNQYYKDTFHDFQDPAVTIQMHVEGTISFDALLFIPKQTPMNFYSKDFEPGLKLYSRSVLIMDANKDLLPDYFNFVKGVVDSPDLNLNISREILQNDPQVQMIANRIERKIQSELASLLKNNREEYEAFWKNFGNAIKYGIYESFGQRKESLQDLLLFEHAKEEGSITLEEYKDGMAKDQEHIYYVSGKKRHLLMQLPKTEYIQSKGYDVLFLLDDIDEFMIQMMNDYHEIQFLSILDESLDIEDEKDQELVEAKTKEVESMLEAVKRVLKSDVEDVRLSKTLSNQPVGLVNEKGISMEMENVLKQMPGSNQDVKAKKILEINMDHPLLDALETLYNKDSSVIDEYGKILYDQALMLAGLPLEDPTMFSQKIAQLMIRLAKEA